MIFLFPYIFYRIRINYKKKNLSNAKTYLVVCLIIIFVNIIKQTFEDICFYEY